MKHLGIALAASMTFLSATYAKSAEAPRSPAESLTFSASFENGPDAEYAKGDAKLYVASSLKRADAKPGLSPELAIVKEEGKRGGALRFLKQTEAAVYYKVDKNLPYKTKDFQGTISFRLKFDPETDLAPGFTDPLQITERAWNDAAIWVDISKDDKPRHFRLGAFADLKVWNPNNADFEKMAPELRPMFDAGKPPFGSDHWSHVAITFEHFNTGENNGVATLYLDGKRAGIVPARNQIFTWKTDQAAIMIGINYKGLFDELMIFDRPLTETEIQKLGAEGSPLAPRER